MPAYNQRVWIKRKTTFSAVVYFALNNYTFLEGQQQRCRCILTTIRAPLFAIRHHSPSYFLLYSCILSSTEQKKKNNNNKHRKRAKHSVKVEAFFSDCVLGYNNTTTNK